MASVYGATSADVAARVPRMDLSATSHPSTGDIDGWILEAEAKLNNALKAGGITTPVTDAEGVRQLKSLTIDYAEGLLRRAAHLSGITGEADGEDKLKSFTAVILDMRDHPSAWSAMLGGGSAETDTATLRSFITHDVDGRSRTNASFAPVFTKVDGGDQF